MDITGIQQLNSISSPILSSDQLHVFKANEYNAVLSYRVNSAALENHFYPIKEINDAIQSLKEKLSSLSQLSSTMLTQTLAKQTYASNDMLNNKKTLLLTNSEMEALINKYPTQDIMDSKANELYADARRLADEMTDFTGAAMVGINQSSVAAAPAESGEEEG